LRRRVIFIIALISTTLACSSPAAPSATTASAQTRTQSQTTTDTTAPWSVPAPAPAPAPPAPTPPAPTPLPAPVPPPAIAPLITAAPASVSISTTQVTTLTVTASGTGPLAYQWFSGASGDATSPVLGATSAAFTTPTLVSTTSYWVRVSGPGGVVNSPSATVTVAVATPPSGSTAFEDQVLVLINQQRAAGAVCGGVTYAPVGPLTMNANLRTAARGHSDDMATQNYFSHTSLDGRTFDQRIRNAGYTSSPAMAENIAAGLWSPQTVVDAWVASPGHCENLMNGAYRSAGVGYSINPYSTYVQYWTMDFGGS
jgi:uncharacterized protein YkwD